jgi:hypothetical protein
LAPQDAQHLAKEFHPIFNEGNLINLPRYSMYLKLMIGGATSLLFSAETLPPQTSKDSLKETIIEHSRKKYRKERAMVEKGVIDRHQQPDDEVIP